MLIPANVRHVKLYDIGNVAQGVIVFPGQDYVNVLEPMRSLVKWSRLGVEVDGSAEKILQTPKAAEENGLFSRLSQLFNKVTSSFTKNHIHWAMWPKIIQVNNQDVYIIGGNDTTVKTERLFGNEF